MCEHAHIWIAAHHMDEVYGIIMPAAFLALSSTFWWTLWQYAEYGFSISCSWKKKSSTLALTVLYVNMLMVQLLLTTWVKLLRIMPSRTLLPAAVLALSLGFGGPNSSTSKSWSSITFGRSGKFWSHALLCSIRHTMILASWTDPGHLLTTFRNFKSASQITCNKQANCCLYS